MDKSSKLGMVPIQKTQVYKEVIDRIIELIDGDEYVPGDGLPSERELSELLGVSRTTLRQGIKVLESTGRLETRVGSGTYICSEQFPQINIQALDIDKKGLGDLITARCGLELTILSAFMDDFRTDENIERLQQHLNKRNLQEQEKLKKSLYVSYKYNFRFEELIAEMTGNKILIFQQQQIHALWIYYWSKLGFLPLKNDSNAEHEKILNAIKDGDKELACIYMRRHIQRDLDEVFAEG